MKRDCRGRILLRQLRGRRFGRLRVLRFGHFSTNRKTYWLCRCICGRTKRVRADSLRDGSITSCGCLGRERRAAANTRHGKNKRKARSPVYGIFYRARNVCRNSSARDYWRYGGRGIELRFQTFLELLAEVGEKPSPDYRLERGDKAGHFEAGNLCWVPCKRRKGR
jgi:hypothetical protein